MAPLADWPSYIDIVRALILAILQGITEIFPISSSGHLVVYSRLFGQEINFNRVLFLHLGALLVILIFYRDEIRVLLTGRWRWKLLLGMGLAFLLTAGLGLVVENLFVDKIMQNPQYVTELWVLNGTMLALAGFFSPRGTRLLTDLRLREFLLIGLVQSISALPGVSRLGVTLVCGLLLHLSWREALMLSFLLSIPVFIASNGYDFMTSQGWSLSAPLQSIQSAHLFSLYSWPAAEDILINLLVLLLSAAASAWAIRYFYRYLDRHLLVYFGAYCLYSGLFFYFILPMV